MMFIEANGQVTQVMGPAPESSGRADVVAYAGAPLPCPET